MVFSRESLSELDLPKPNNVPYWSELSVYSYKTANLSFLCPMTISNLFSNGLTTYLVAYFVCKLFYKKEGLNS